MAGPNSFGMEVELEESVAKSAEQAECRLVAPLAPRPFSLNGKDQSLQLSFNERNRSQHQHFRERQPPRSTCRPRSASTGCARAGPTRGCTCRGSTSSAHRFSLQLQKVTHMSTSNGSSTISAKLRSASRICSRCSGVARSSRSLGSSFGNLDGSMSVPASGVPGIGRTKDARSGPFSLRNWRRRSASQLKVASPAASQVRVRLARTLIGKKRG